MDLNKLRTFCIVAEHGSVTKAAARLFRTQPAITQQIQQLEEDAGLALLERRGSKIFLTKEGEALFHFAKLRIMQIDDEAARLKKDAGALEGVIRVAALDELYEYVLPGLISDFNRIYPNIDFEILAGNHAQLEDYLINNAADFGFMVLYQERKLFEIFPYLTCERICVASPTYLERQKPIKSLQDLLSHDIIDHSPTLSSFKFWLKKNDSKIEKLFKEKSAKIAIRGTEAQKHLLLKGKGAGMMYRFLIEDDLNEGRLIQILPRKTKSIQVTYDIARKKKHTPQFIHEKFFDFVMEHAKHSGSVK